MMSSRFVWQECDRRGARVIQPSTSRVITSASVAGDNPHLGIFAHAYNDVSKLFVQALTLIRTRILAMPNKLAPEMVGLKHPAEAQRIMMAGVTDLLSARRGHRPCRSRGREEADSVRGFSPVAQQSLVLSLRRRMQRTVRRPRLFRSAMTATNS
jgi:hypothetical protein